MRVLIASLWAATGCCHLWVAYYTSGLQDAPKQACWGAPGPGRRKSLLAARWSWCEMLLNAVVVVVSSSGLAGGQVGRWADGPGAGRRQLSSRGSEQRCVAAAQRPSRRAFVLPWAWIQGGEAAGRRCGAQGRAGGGHEGMRACELARLPRRDPPAHHHR
jgi:hypothetical protein